MIIDCLFLRKQVRALQTSLNIYFVFTFGFSL